MYNSSRKCIKQSRLAWVWLPFWIVQFSNGRDQNRATKDHSNSKHVGAPAVFFKKCQMFFQIRQPELLCLVYEELNLAPPSCVRELFSPSQRSDCSSVQPSSANSESIRSNPSLAFDLNSRAPSTAAMSKLRRLSSFDSHKMLQINVGAGDKKGAKAAVNILTAKRKTG